MDNARTLIYIESDIQNVGMVYGVVDLGEYLQMSFEQVCHCLPVSSLGDAARVQVIMVQSHGGGSDELAAAQQLRKDVDILEFLAHRIGESAEQFPSVYLVPCVGMSVCLAFQPVLPHVGILCVLPEIEYALTGYVTVFLVYGIFKDVIVGM